MRVASLAAILCAAALLLAACGGGGSEPAPPSTGGTPAAPPPSSGAGSAAQETGAAGTGATRLPAIVVRSPKPHATVSSPVTISGTANVFEANVTVVVEDGSGKQLAQDFTTASCGTGCRGDYSIDLPFLVAGEQEGTIVVHDDDAAGTGTPPHVVRIPVTLSP